MVSNGNGLDSARHAVPIARELASVPPSAPGAVTEGELPVQHARPTAEATVGPPGDREPGGVDRRPKQSGDTGQAEGPSTDAARTSVLRRHPILIPTGALVLALALVGGYLYWDDTRH